MALRIPSYASPISQLLHQLLPPPPSIRTTSSSRLSRFFRQLSISPSSVIPLSTQLSIPALLSGVWESILRAVPKKKTSHRKKRQRQLAGKALKDVESLNKCPACGRVKRKHMLCPHCVEAIRRKWKKAMNSGRDPEPESKDEPDATVER